MEKQTRHKGLSICQANLHAKDYRRWVSAASCDRGFEYPCRARCGLALHADQSACLAARGVPGFPPTRRLSLPAERTKRGHVMTRCWRFLAAAPSYQPTDQSVTILPMIAKNNVAKPGAIRLVPARLLHSCRYRGGLGPSFGVKFRPPRSRPFTED